MEFNKEHLEVFKSTLSDSLPAWVGTSPRSWTKYVFEVPNQPDQPQVLSETALSRQDLFNMTNDESVGDEAFAVSILAWGAMKRTHGRMLFRKAHYWLPVVNRLRNSSVDGIEAYAKFQELRADGNLTGMGPAYFTKLIFFAAPAHDGFIMDQRTARSANLLLIGENLVHTTVLRSRTGKIEHTVSDRNNGETYVKFCKFIHELAKKVGHEGKEARIEEALFSTGRGQGRWRNHVIMHG